MWLIIYAKIEEATKKIIESMTSGSNSVKEAFQSWQAPWTKERAEKLDQIDALAKEATVTSGKEELHKEHEALTALIGKRADAVDSSIKEETKKVDSLSQNVLAQQSFFTASYISAKIDVDNNEFKNGDKTAIELQGSGRLLALFVFASTNTNSAFELAGKYTLSYGCSLDGKEIYKLSKKQGGANDFLFSNTSQRVVNPYIFDSNNLKQALYQINRTKNQENGAAKYYHTDRYGQVTTYIPIIKEDLFYNAVAALPQNYLGVYGKKFEKSLKVDIKKDTVLHQYITDNDYSSSTMSIWVTALVATDNKE